MARIARGLKGGGGGVQTFLMLRIWPLCWSALLLCRTADHAKVEIVY